MTGADLKEHLHSCLRDARAALLWKLDGLSEFDARRPLTAHGTNLLGLVKHLAGCEIGYFGYVFDRPFSNPPTWLTESADPTVDMWASVTETRHDIIDLYRRACAHSDTTIATFPLEHPGTVPTWPTHRRRVTLHQILVHMLAETARHAGHADIVRELIDQQAGLHADRQALPDVDTDYWVHLHRRIEHAARDVDNLAPKPLVTLRPMTAIEYEAATKIREAEALRELTKHIPAHLAQERVRRGTAQFLPDGLNTVGHHLIVAVDASDTVVGHAWFGPDPRRATQTRDGAWLHDLFIYPAFRRHGYGLAVLDALEQLAKTQGANHLALNVAGDNTAARALYQHAGYTITSQYLRKDFHSQPKLDPQHSSFPIHRY